MISNISNMHHRMLINTLLFLCLSAFLPNGLQNDEETTGFIRVRGLVFAVCEMTSFPKELKGFSTSRMCIIEYL